MVNNCLVELIKSTMEKIFEIEKSFEIRDLLFRIIGLLIPDHHNALKVSEELMNRLIYYSNASDFIDSQEELIVNYNLIKEIVKFNNKS